MKKGSYTVEAALLMGVLIPLLVGVIYLGFFMMIRGNVQGEAIEKALKNEGGYVFDPDDAGGETFAGIARRYHKIWKGWKIIDNYKKEFNLPKDKKQFNDKCFSDKKLMALVHSFYKDNFWDPFKLDLIPSFDIAFLIFDTAINMGLVKAIKFAQQAVGLKETGKYDDELFNRLVKYGKK